LRNISHPDLRRGAAITFWYSAMIARYAILPLRDRRRAKLAHRAGDDGAIRHAQRAFRRRRLYFRHEDPRSGSCFKAWFFWGGILCHERFISALPRSCLSE